VRADLCAVQLHDHVYEVTELIVRLESERSTDALSSVHSEGIAQEQPTLVVNMNCNGHEGGRKVEDLMRQIHTYFPVSLRAPPT